MKRYTRTDLWCAAFIAGSIAVFATHLALFIAQQAGVKL